MRNRLLLIGTIVLCLLGIYLAGTHRIEHRLGRALAKAAPAARRVLPASVKEALRDLAEMLPITERPFDWTARKAGSVVYFGIVAFFVTQLRLRGRAPRSFGSILVTAVIAGVLMSGLIELLEAPEWEADVVFDLMLGAVGGLLASIGVFLWQRMSRRRSPIS